MMMTHGIGRPRNFDQAALINFVQESSREEAHATD
jgi:hypothetical protein